MPSCSNHGARFVQVDVQMFVLYKIVIVRHRPKLKQELHMQDFTVDCTHKKHLFLDSAGQFLKGPYTLHMHAHVVGHSCISKRAVST